MSSRETFFVDTNVLLRFFLSDHDEQSPAAVGFFARFAASEFNIVITDSVVFEAVYVMQGRIYKVDRSEIVEKLTRFLSSDGVEIIGVVDFDAVT